MARLCFAARGPLTGGPYPFKFSRSKRKLVDKKLFSSCMRRSSRCTDFIFSWRFNLDRETCASLEALISSLSSTIFDFSLSTSTR